MTLGRGHKFAGLPLLKTLPDYDDLPPTRPSGHRPRTGQVTHGRREPSLPPGALESGVTRAPSTAAARQSSPTPPRAANEAPRIAGKYFIGEQIGAGGLATVHIGHEALDGGSGRVVAIKRLHPQLAREPEVAATLLDEGRIVSRITHPNVVSLFDIVVEDGDIFLVLEYVEGASLATLARTAREARLRIPAEIACAIARDVLRGLHAAHEATDERARPLGVVHRDVSPHNVLVGTDGRARILDFGLAKAAGQSHTTRPGEIKGKLSYMAPEHLRGGLVTRRSDIYSATIVLWEMLTLDRPFGDPKDTDAALDELVSRQALAPSTLAAGVPPALDPIVLRGLAIDPTARYATADDMARSLERALPSASPPRVASWMREVTRAAKPSNPRWYDSGVGPSSGFRIKDFSG